MHAKTGGLARKPFTSGAASSCWTQASCRQERARQGRRLARSTICRGQGNSEDAEPCLRRQFLAGAFVAASLAAVDPACAVQGLTAGRIPGLSKEQDDEGFRTYTRPEGKSGGHGVGWSEIPPYQFKVPEGWSEVPVSIADLGGTEIDLRFGNNADGNLAIVVAPVLRFLDVGFNSDVRIEELGSPEKLINGFGPELFGSPLQELRLQDGDVTDTRVEQRQGLTFYNWELKPHRLVAATAYKNRVFLMAMEANARQWRKSQAKLKKMQNSFGLAGLQA